MTYTDNQMNYIVSVNGKAHQSAVEIIGSLDKEIQQLQKENTEMKAKIKELENGKDSNKD